MLDHLARCRAVCFPPLEEDYGFVTAEAFASRKAVITCRDSGGPAELVEDGVSGFVSEPTPQALSAALRRVMDDAALAERMGAAAAAAGAKLNWADAVRQLME
jgi:glycosyltransferase involved in cell wall biosynthesis